MEGGCAVCGQLVPLSQLSRLSDSQCDLDILVREGMGITRLERSSLNDPIREIKGPILDQTCTKICRSCKSSLDEGLTPKYALANGLWLGKSHLSCKICLMPSNFSFLVSVGTSVLFRCHLGCTK